MEEIKVKNKGKGKRMDQRLVIGLICIGILLIVLGASIGYIRGYEGAKEIYRDDSFIYQGLWLDTMGEWMDAIEAYDDCQADLVSKLSFTNVGSSHVFQH